jgi:hypothetical protein
MDKIFEQAWLTIVAISAADSESGFVGGSRSSNVRQFFASRDQSGLFATLPSLPSEIVNESAWSTRGWCFQEELLSKRMLFLADNMYWMSCRSKKYASLYQESGEHEDETGSAVWSMLLASEQRSRQRVRGGDWTEYEDRAYDIHNYMEIVRAYSRRQLSYPEDIVHAFAGIIRRTQKKLDVTLHSGIPLGKYLLPFLCWEILPLRYRGRSPKTRRLGFPSWCWTGWYGEPDWEALLNHCKYSYDLARDAPVFEFLPSSVLKTAQLVGAQDGVLCLATERATLSFQFFKQQAFVHGGGEVSYCGILHNGRVHRSGNPLYLQQRGCFFLSRQDEDDLVRSTSGSTFEADFISLLAIDSVDDSFFINPSVWAMMVLPVNKHDVAVRRAAIVHVPMDVWVAARPKEEHVILV